MNVKWQKMSKFEEDNINFSCKNKTILVNIYCFIIKLVLNMLGVDILFFISLFTGLVSDQGTRILQAGSR